MRAIILAAGEGKRLQPLTLNKPKPLLEIRGQSILENMINYLKKSGIEDIIVVTGYKYQLFYKLQKKLNFQQIIFKDYQGVNSAESLKFVAKYIIKGTFILNGDLYITQPFMHYIKKGHSQILAQKILHATPSWGYITDENQKLLDIDTNAIEGYGDGIAFFDNAKEIELLKNALLKCHKEDYWEKCILHSLANIDYFISFCKSYYIEIDSLKDALKANLITPQEIALQCSDDEKAEKLFSITNTNYKINFLKECKVLRIPSQGREKIINTNEEEKILALLPKNIAPKSEFFANEFKMTTFLEGYKPLSFEDLKDDKILLLLIQTLKKLHIYKHKDYPNFQKIPMVDEIYKYEKIANIKLTTPIEHKLLLEVAKSLDEGEFILCHRDLQLPNILYNGKTLKLIDFEYAGFSSILWELGNLSAELELSKEQIHKIASMYGDISYKDILKGQLMANYIWSLWSWFYHKIDLGRSYLLRFHKNLQELSHL